METFQKCVSLVFAGGEHLIRSLISWAHRHYYIMYRYMYHTLFTWWSAKRFQQERSVKMKLLSWNFLKMYII